MRATSSRQLSPAAIKALLREENRLRLCDETMTVYDRAREQGIDAFVVPELIQKEVAKRFGMREEVAVEGVPMARVRRKARRGREPRRPRAAAASAAVGVRRASRAPIRRTFRRGGRGARSAEGRWRWRREEVASAEV